MIRMATMLVALALAASPAAADGRAGEPLRLVLDRGSIVVIGPVVRDGALLTFTTTDGRLGSIQARRVVRVVSLASGRSSAPPPAARERATAPRAAASGTRFSNDDLPAPATRGGTITNADLADAPPAPSGPALTNDDLPPGAEEAEEAEEAPAEETDDRAALDEFVAGLAPAPAAAPDDDALDPLAVEAELAVLDERIAIAEREENTFYRLMVCVQHGLSPRSPECTPRLRPRPSANPSLSERSLSAKVLAARSRADEARAEREALVERAREAGIAVD